VVFIGIYRISGSGLPDIRPFLEIRFWLRFRPKKVPGTRYLDRILIGSFWQLVRQRYPEIWPRTVAINAPGFTLAWHYWASQLQTLSTDTLMSPREGSDVPVGLLHTCIPSCCTTAPAFSRSSPAGGSATSAQHVRPSGIRCRWPDDIQRSARWAARPHH